MAQQTKTKSSGSSSTRRSSAKGRTRAKPSRRSNASSSNSKSVVDAAKDATVESANTAGTAITSAAKKLKTPAIAAGMGLAGVAGGIALSRGRDKKVLGVSLPNGGTARATSKNLAHAAKNLGAFAERAGTVAEQARIVSEAIGESGTRGKSPVEVVLEGLTSRSRSRSGR